MASKMPMGLVGMLQGKNFVKPKPKKATVASKDAIKRKLASAPKKPLMPSDNDGDEGGY